jgi:hypothetical protein
MNSIEFMGGVYQISGGLITFGVSQFEKYDVRFEKMEAANDTLRNDLLDCMVNRARLEERVQAIEEQKSKKKR